MTSEIRFSGIIQHTSLAPSEIPPSKLKEGRIPAGKVVNRIKPGQKIDVFIMKNAHTLVLDETAKINEDDIRKRKTYTYTDISDSSFKNQRLALGTGFFKGMENTDTIYLILH
jgi:hypothetical protein